MKSVMIPTVERRAYQPFDERHQYSDGQHFDGPGGAGDRDGYVTGNPLREFRRLASSLNVESARVVSVAERSPNNSDRGNRSLGELRQFAQRTSDLNRSSGAESLNAREIGPINSPTEIIGVTNVTQSASLFGAGTLQLGHGISVTAPPPHWSIRRGPTRSTASTT